MLSEPVLIFLGSLTASILFTAAAFGVLFVLAFIVALFTKD